METLSGTLTEQFIKRIKDLDKSRTLVELYSLEREIRRDIIAAKFYWVKELWLTHKLNNTTFDSSLKFTYNGT